MDNYSTAPGLSQMLRPILQEEGAVKVTLEVMPWRLVIHKTQDGFCVAGPGIRDFKQWLAKRGWTLQAIDAARNIVEIAIIH